MTAYALAVVAGGVPAGRWHIAACQRHLADLQAASARGWSWRPDYADRVFRFFRLLRHYKGEWAGQPMTLQPWQQFVIGSLFGWLDTATGFRRFRNAFLEFPRGQGKSTMAAGVLLFGTFIEGEGGADGFSFATKRDQARIVFNAARQMVLRSPALRKIITPQRHTLYQEGTESQISPLGADFNTQDGLRPHIAVGDEIHRQKTADLIEVIESGMGTRRQPMLIEITTKGDDDAGVYAQHFGVSTQVLSGTVDLPEWFAFIASANPEDDPTLPATWEKANPNYGVSVKPGFLLKKCQQAIANPAAMPEFKRVHLGQSAQASESYLSLDHWDRCPGGIAPGAPAFPSEDVLRASPCWIGLDLSSKIDLTAAACVWLIDEMQFAIKVTLWVPGEGLEARRRRDRVPYDAWAADGAIVATEGNTIDRKLVRHTVRDLSREWKAPVCFDPWHASELTQTLKDDDGIQLFEISQRFQLLSEPTKRLQMEILETTFAHDRNPALRWMVGNFAVKRDDKDNHMPCKKRSRGRIDGLQATVTALSQAIRQVRRVAEDPDVMVV